VIEANSQKTDTLASNAAVIVSAMKALEAEAPKTLAANAMT
jgi:hypothetical protein